MNASPPADQGIRRHACVALIVQFIGCKNAGCGNGRHGQKQGEAGGEWTIETKESPGCHRDAGSADAGNDGKALHQPDNEGIAKCDRFGFVLGNRRPIRHP